ncbi:MAG: proline dehydrogenase [Anaerolineales bacterium]|nr:proline dehydrogenase [Anaerolineae bacterium]PWB54442.1 MAG: proline dehydrogenase [Anaerolineales bacterium]
MFRSFFSYLAKAAWARKIVAKWSIAWKMASRFIAGETLADGIRVIKTLNAAGINATLDHLGENTDSPEKARQATQDIIQAFDAIEEAGVRANVSIKLTQIGLGISDELTLENLLQILNTARKYHSFVRIDMEDSPVTQRTINILYKAREAGYENVGIVIQAYLYRSEADIRKLLEDCFKVRLCKGAYTEPAKVAYPKMKDVDANYDRCAALLIDGSLARECPPLSPDGKTPPIPGLATHDARRIDFAKQYAAKVGLPNDAMEFQMLNGIRKDLQDGLVKEGYRVRVYVPYGTEWYPYFMRRIAERPADLLFLLPRFNFK